MLTNDNKNKIVSDIWVDVLGLDKVDREQNFFTCGGDSLLAVRFIARCREKGINVSPVDLYKKRTLGKVLESISDVDYKASDNKKGNVNSIHKLLPTQSRWFDEEPIDIDHFNLGGLFISPKGLKIEILKKAVEKVLNRQEALRTAFYKYDNVWTAEVLPPDTSKVLIKAEYDDYTDKIPQLEEECSKAQKSMDIRNGVVFKVLYFPFKSEQGRLLILAHHCCLDGFSVNLLADELETAIFNCMTNNDEKHQPLQPYEYVNAIENWISTQEATENVKEWLSLPWDRLGTVPKEIEGEGYLTGITTLTGMFSIEETNFLSKIAQEQGINISDLLLGAAVNAISDWCQHKTLGIDVYYHGRDISPYQIDTSKTIAYILNTYPVLLNFEANGIRNNWKEEIANQFKKIPKLKYGFDALKFSEHKLSNKLKKLPKMNIRYNFRGHMKRIIFRANNEIKPSTENISFGRNRSPLQKEKYLLMLEGDIIDGQLIYGIKFSRDLYTKETIQLLITKAMDILRTKTGPEEVVFNGYKGKTFHYSEDN